MRGSRGSAKWNGSWSESSAATSSCVRASASRAHDACTCSRSSTGWKAAGSRPTWTRKAAAGEPALDGDEEARVGDAARDDGRGRPAGEVDRVLQRDEGPIGVAEDHVPL